MKRFQFRLQRVLNFRTSEKKERERELALKNGELKSAEQKLNGIVQAQDKATVTEEGLQTMAELHLSGDYQALLREALVNQRLLVIEASEAVDAARDAYIQKAIEAETLATLRERKMEDHRAENKRLDRKQLDEIAVQRHRYNKNNDDEGGTNGA